MITEELVAYVNQQRQAGVSDQAIKEAILSVGWSQQDADEALVASAAQMAQEPAVSETPEEQGQDQTSFSQEEDKREPATEEKLPQDQSQETNQAASQEESLDQQVAKEPSQEEKETPSEQSELRQQDDSSPLSQEKPTDTTDQEDNLPQEEELEKPEPAVDNQSGPVELDDQGRPVTGKAEQAPDQEQPLKTENDLAKPVSFSPTGQKPVGEDVEPQESELAQEPALTADQELPSQETSPETPLNQGSQPTQKPASTSQEGSSQVAIDPKAQDK